MTARRSEYGGAFLALVSAFPSSPSFRAMKEDFSFSFLGFFFASLFYNYKCSSCQLAIPLPVIPRH